MIIEGQILKMISEHSKPIRYYLNFENEFLEINQLLGKNIRLTHDHNQSKGCNLDKHIYRMGYCQECFFTLPQANESIIRPELSTAHLGIEQRDLEWEKRFELQPHIVYLALSPDLKVGVTRLNQIPTRWIDQGASAAIILAKTDNRYEAGMIEVAMKEGLSDKTNYRRMLLNNIEDIDLILKKEKFKKLVPEEFAHFITNDQEILSFDYPILKQPTKINVIKLDSHNAYEGKLVGIKGQYWIFEDESVWNLRAHEGRYMKIEV